MRNIFITALILFTIALINPSFAATRFYLPSTGAAEVSPVLTTLGWNNTANADSIRIMTVRRGAAMTSKSITINANNQNILNRQYISDPIAGGEISGTVKGQLRGLADALSNYSAVGIWVVSNDGATFRGTLLPITYLGSGNYSQTVLTNRYSPISSSLTAVTAQNGDRIVIEIGFRRSGGGSATTTQSFGDDSGNDLPENETETLAYNPWIEFSQDIIFPSVSFVD